MTTQTEIIQMIREHITKEILQTVVELADDVPLIERGHLTSLQTVQLLMFIGETYGVEIEPEEVNEEVFRSLTTIAALVRRKLAA